MQPYWQSAEKRTAWRLLVFVLVAEASQLTLITSFTFVNAALFDALDARQAEDAWRATAMWFGVLFSSIVVTVIQVHVQQKLIIHWRRFLTERYLTRYLDAHLYNQLELGDYELDNPDQRISMDMLNITQETLELGLNFLTTFGRLIVFSGVLWVVSGPLEFSVLGVDVVIPGYMFWVAVVYAVVGTWLTHRLAHPMAALNFQKQAVEADFRYQLVRLRENAESIALIGGEAKEHDTFNKKFTGIWDNWMVLLKYKKRLTAFTEALTRTSSVLPYLVAIPALLAGTIAIGGFMQLGVAFGVVQTSLAWFATSYEKIAIWKSSVDRVLSFDDALGAASAEQADSLIARQPSSGDDFELKGLTLNLPNGDPLLENSGVRFEPGQDVLISGPSGSGKTTLFRLFSGLWIWGNGDVRIPQGKVMFLPQKPYLPIGTLRDVLTYPNQEEAGVSTAKLHEIMRTCRLEKFIDRLDEVCDWSRILSGGEQQRVSFVRVFLARPDWLFLDEATAAMDPGTESALYSALKLELPNTTIVSIAHRPSLRKHHDLQIKLEPGNLSLSSTPIASGH